ncbi:MAG: FtsH protease activity modulator HflK [Planctomycetota bacterium JB042]
MTAPHVRWTWRVIVAAGAAVALWVGVGLLTPWRGEVPGLGRLVPWIPRTAAKSSLFWVVDQDERAVVLRFGGVARTVGPGLQFTLPWPVETLERVATSRVMQTSVGFRLLDRANNLLPSADEVQWLTGDTNLVEMQAIVLWTVKDPSDFLFTLGEPPPPDLGGFTVERDVHRGSYPIRRAAEAVFSRLVATATIDDILTIGKTKLQTDAQAEVQAELDRFGAGVEVTAVNIVEVNPPLRVIGAFTAVSTERADRERRIDEARGYEMQVKPRARARANRVLKDADVHRTKVVNAAQGVARSFEKLAAEVEQNPAIARRRIWLDAVARIVARGRKIVVQPVEGGEQVRVYLDDVR